MSETNYPEKNDDNNNRRQKILGVLFYSGLLSPLFFYVWFFDRPELSFFGITLPLYSFWMAMLFLDMRITLSLKDLIKLYEENGMFRFLYTKYRRSVAVILQLIVEAVFILVLPSLMFPREFGVQLFWDYQTSAIFASIVGIFHLIAWHHNRKNVREILDNQKSS